MKNSHLDYTNRRRFLKIGAGIIATVGGVAQPAWAAWETVDFGWDGLNIGSLTIYKVMFEIVDDNGSQKVSCYVNFKNTGGAKDWQFGYKFSTDTDYSMIEDIELPTQLNAGDSVTKSFTLTIPSSENPTKLKGLYGSGSDTIEAKATVSNSTP